MPTAHSTTWRYERSDWSGAQYKNTQQSSGSAPIISYYDSHGRKVRSISTAVDGRLIYRDTRYDALGRKTAASRPYFAGDSTYWVNFHYDDYSRLARRVEPHTHGQSKHTHYSYSPLAQTITNPLGHQQTHYSDAKGKTIKTDQQGAIIEHHYDALGRLVKTTNAKGQQTSISYDKRGRKTAITDPVMGNWSYHYDGFDNLIRQTDAKGQITHSHYDLLNRKTRQTVTGGEATWTYDNAPGKGTGKLASVTSPLGHRKIYHYDSLGRLSQLQTQWQGQTYNSRTHYDHHSRIAHITHPNHLQVHNVYGQHGHLVAIRTPKNQVQDYNAQFIIQQLIKAERLLALAEIDRHKHQQRAELYATLANSFKLFSRNSYYNLYVNEQKIQQANHAINQLHQLSSAANTNARIIKQNNIDKYRRAIQFYKMGYLQSSYGDIWKQGSDYLEAQLELETLKAQKYMQIATENMAIIAALNNARNTSIYGDQLRYSFSTHHLFSLSPSAYDSILNTVTDFQHKAQESIRKASTLQHKQASFLALLGENAQSANDHLTWYRIAQSDSEGRTSAALYGNGLFSSWDYDAASGQLLAIETGNMAKGNSDDIQHLSLHYDALNNLTHKHDHLTHRSESMSYDHSDRLIQHSASTIANPHTQTAATPNWNHHYSYNAHGDILHGPAGHYLYGDANNQRGVLLSVNGRHLHYDANGNITQTADGTHISYNLHNKPTTFIKSGNITGFAYDAQGNRFLKTINGQSSLHIGKLYQKNLSNGDSINHIYFGNKHIASYHKRSDGSAHSSYMHSDALGNIDVVTNQQRRHPQTLRL